MSKGWKRGNGPANYEFDDYPSPHYDPTIPPKERERLIISAQRDLDEVVAKIKAANKTHMDS